MSATCKRPVTQNPIRGMLLEFMSMELAYRHSSTVFEGKHTQHASCNYFNRYAALEWKSCGKSEPRFRSKSFARSLARSRGSSSSPEPTRSVFLSGGQNSSRRGYKRKDWRIQKKKKRKTLNAAGDGFAGYFSSWNFSCFLILIFVILVSFPKISYFVLLCLIILLMFIQLYIYVY